MGSMWAEENEFFKFYNELQKSAVYFSSLAFRQMMPREGRRGEEDSFQNFYQTAEDTGSISSAKVSKKALQAPKPTPLVPVISISDYQNVGVGLKKRVNFAHPLLVKSPTPNMMQMWEGGGSGEGDVLEDGVVTHELYGDESFPNDPSIVAESLAQYLSVGVCGDEDESQEPSGQQDATNNRRRKRRSRKKRNKDNHLETDEQQQFEQDYSYYDENDPFAVFAAPLNEEDYEFISDVRRCGDTHDNSEQPKPVKVCDEDGLSQMKQLYGDGGAQRILQMEQVIEADFLSESKRILG